MRKLLLILTLFVSAAVLGQDYALSFEQSVDGDSYVLEVFVTGDNNAFELGSSNFPFEVISNGVDQSTLTVDEKGAFSEVDPESYNGMYFSNTAGFEHLYVLRNMMGNGTGATVDASKRLLASIKGDITDPCQTAQVNWIVEKGVITDFEGSVIKSSALYENSEVINLIPDIPVFDIVNEGEVLVTSSLENVSYQWFLNDEPIDGARENTYSFEDNGVYKLAVANACETIYSEELEVSSVTEVVDSEILDLNLSAYPNPYASQTSIEINVPETKMFKLTLNDLTGTSIETVYEGVLTQGMHEIEFSVRDFGLSAGVYVLRLSNNEVSRNIKIIETE